MTSTQTITDQITEAQEAKAQAQKKAGDLELQIHLATCMRRNAEEAACSEEGVGAATKEFNKISRRLSDLEYELHMAKAAHGVACRKLHELNQAAGIAD